MSEIKYEIKETSNEEFYVSFSIGNQTFTLRHTDNMESAEFFVRMLKQALRKPCCIDHQSQLREAKSLLDAVNCPQRCNKGAIQISEDEWIQCEWCGRKEDLLKQITQKGEQKQ